LILIKAADANGNGAEGDTTLEAVSTKTVFPAAATSSSSPILALTTPSRTIDSIGNRVTVGVLKPAPTSTTTSFPPGDASASSTHVTIAAF
jgi:hypothetical protein